MHTGNIVWADWLNFVKVELQKTLLQMGYKLTSL